jgi:hypothetical protein
MTDGVSYEGVFGNEVLCEQAASAPSSAVRSRRLAKGVSMEVCADAAPALLPPACMPAPAPMPKCEPMPMPEPPREKEKKDSDVDEKRQDKAENPKLDPALWGLEAKLVNGNYTDANLKVENGWVEVVIRLNDDSDASLDALRGVGVQVISVAHSSMKVMARIRVTDLAKTAELACVDRIAPPSK